jgi:hypothetical protein
VDLGAYRCLSLIVGPAQVRIGPNECAGWCTTGLSDGAGNWVLQPLPNNDHAYMSYVIRNTHSRATIAVDAQSYMDVASNAISSKVPSTVPTQVRTPA